MPAPAGRAAVNVGDDVRLLVRQVLANASSGEFIYSTRVFEGTVGWALVRVGKRGSRRNRQSYGLLRCGEGSFMRRLSSSSAEIQGPVLWRVSRLAATTLFAPSAAAASWRRAKLSLSGCNRFLEIVLAGLVVDDHEAIRCFIHRSMYAWSFMGGSGGGPRRLCARCQVCAGLQLC